MTTDAVDVLIVGLDQDAERELAREDGFTVRRVTSLAELDHAIEADAVVVELDGAAPLEVVRALRNRAPNAAIVVLTDDAHTADGTVALHAGAEEHLVKGAVPVGLLPRAVRYAVGMRRLRRELATTDEATRLPNLRGFVPIADHHLRMSDRTGNPVVLVFVRLDDHAEVRQTLGASAADEVVTDAAEVVLEAVRDADAPARIAPDTFCILLTGAAEGSETVVLSRLVEAIAQHDARRDRPRALSLSVGTARYEPGSGTPLSHILEAAQRRMAPGADVR
jgi:diguanylate cyclase (GGDEF)-like protein